MERFQPSSDLQAFRRALGRFGTGVTVITALEHGTPIGITANSFSSLSLDPPLVLWSPAKSSARHDAFVAADAFNVHILANSQKPICEAFVRNKHGFTGVAHTINADGIPVLSDCLAVFECRTAALHEGGDHTLVIGRVEEYSSMEGSPLLFLNGQYHTPCQS